MSTEIVSKNFNWKIALAAQKACILEVDAPKVGNVNRYHDFADTSLEDFHYSALAIGRPFGYLEEQGVGRTIFEAVKATRQAVDSNTNLGIILLLAPLGMAWSRMSQKGRITSNPQDSKTLSDNWKQAITLVLESLTIEDTRYVYQAIRLANPSGMGRVNAHDVFQDESPEITLLEAMNLSAERDLIARQYKEHFDLVICNGYEEFKRSLGQGIPLPQAIAHTHLFLLSQVQDSLITRKLGEQWSIRVRDKARNVWKQGGWLCAAGQKHIFKFDRWLRGNGQKNNLNPGSTADLIAAIIFVYLLEQNLIKNIGR
ncbi:MAG: triphosphoribosyl-dephospho-CoA synthetase [Peptococcaceae bacterium]|nr:triphosphoribosyl-dephospho-CoA synthetase [Peptococcaceae bacterium]